MSADKADRPRRARPLLQVSVWVPSEDWQMLAATAGVMGETQGTIVSRGLRMYHDSLPKDDQRAIQQSMALRSKRKPARNK